MPDQIDNAIKAGAITMEETERLIELAALRQDRELCGMSFELVTTMRDGTEHRQRICPSMVTRNHVTGDCVVGLQGSSVMIRAGHKLGKAHGMLAVQRPESERVCCLGDCKGEPVSRCQSNSSE